MIGVEVRVVGVRRFFLLKEPEHCGQEAHYNESSHNRQKNNLGRILLRLRRRIIRRTGGPRTYLLLTNGLGRRDHDPLRLGAAGKVVAATNHCRLSGLVLEILTRKSREFGRIFFKQRRAVLGAKLNDLFVVTLVALGAVFHKADPVSRYRNATHFSTE